MQTRLTNPLVSFFWLLVFFFPIKFHFFVLNAEYASENNDVNDQRVDQEDNCIVEEYIPRSFQNINHFGEYERKLLETTERQMVKVRMFTMTSSNPSTNAFSSSSSTSKIGRQQEMDSTNSLNAASSLANIVFCKGCPDPNLEGSHAIGLIAKNAQKAKSFDITAALDIAVPNDAQTDLLNVMDDNDFEYQLALAKKMRFQFTKEELLLKCEDWSKYLQSIGSQGVKKNSNLLKIKKNWMNNHRGNRHHEAEREGENNTPTKQKNTNNMTFKKDNLYWDYTKESCYNVILGNNEKIDETNRENFASLQGKIVLIDRGMVPLVVKVIRAQRMGAVGVLLVDDGQCNTNFSYCGERAGNTMEGGFAPHDGYAQWNEVEIPVLLISRFTGYKLKILMGLIEFEVKDMGKQLVKDEERLSSLYTHLLSHKERYSDYRKKNKSDKETEIQKLKSNSKYERMRHKLNQKNRYPESTADQYSRSDFQQIEIIEPDLQYFYKQYADFFKNPLGLNQPMLLI